MLNTNEVSEFVGLAKLVDEDYVQLCACGEFGSTSHDNLRSLVYIALEKMNVECNILDSMLITSFPF